MPYQISNQKNQTTQLCTALRPCIIEYAVIVDVNGSLCNTAYWDMPKHETGNV